MMESRPLTVGVTPRWLSRHGEYFLSFSDELLSYLRSEIGCAVVPLTPHNRGDFDKCDVLVLSGGENISEASPRDLFEKTLLSVGLKQKKSVIGICRGMQLIATCFGSDLEEVDGHVSQLSTLKANDASFQFNATCYHSLRVTDVPAGFQLEYAHAGDGSIEAISNNDLNIYACMWHPEREQAGSDSRTILSDFLKRNFT